MEADIIIVTNSTGLGGVERVSVNLANYWNSIGKKVVFISFYKVKNNSYLLNSNVTEINFTQTIRNKNEKSQNWVSKLIIDLSQYPFFSKIYYFVFKFIIHPFFNLFRINPSIFSFVYNKKVQFLKTNFNAYPNAKILSLELCNNVLSLLALKNNTRKIIISERSDFNTLPKRKFYWQELAKELYNNADKIICNSMQQVNQLSNFVEITPIFHISNPVNLVKKTSPTNVENVLVEFTIVARVDKEKGYMELIEALKILSASNTCKLNIYGEGELTNKLKAKIKALKLEKQVIWHGFVNDWYKTDLDNQIFILPSKAEGQSNSLLEALSLGMPVIVSDIPAFTEVIDHNITGLISKVGNSYDIACQMKHLIDDKGLRSKLSANGFNLSSQFHENKIMPLWTKVVFEK